MCTQSILRVNVVTVCLSMIRATYPVSTNVAIDFCDARMVDGKNERRGARTRTKQF